ncbi:hypothetical protein N624_0958 [Levilactobacillus brevis]|nr:hypothetical protein N624_0958 [Levilactobacillus brevis]KIO97070.1 hypothetical protein N627_2042 [Levilactobacillus brevis]
MALWNFVDFVCLKNVMKAFDNYWENVYHNIMKSPTGF